MEVRVIWEVDIDAEERKEAAQQAEAIQTDAWHVGHRL
jgi:hypothetical protein